MSTSSNDVARPSMLTFDEFYLEYLRLHANRWCRIWHTLGPIVGLSCFLACLYYQVYWLIVLVPIPIYSCSWIGHWVARTKPAVFGRPWWSFRAYWKMTLDLKGAVTAKAGGHSGSRR